MHPVCRLLLGLELRHGSEQLLAQLRRLLWVQRYARRTERLVPSGGSQVYGSDFARCGRLQSWLHGRRNVPGEVDPRSAFEIRIEVWCVEVVLSGDADQGEEGVAPGIGQRRPHLARRSGFANCADRPLG